MIITRNVDLSVGSVLGLSAYATGRLFIDFPGIPIIVVFLIGIAFGAVLGLINGALIAFAKVPALVITLGTLYVYRGINVVWTGSDRINSSDMPAEFLALGTGSILFIPILTIIALVVLVIAGWYMRNRRGGRELYAIGSDPAAAQPVRPQGHAARARGVHRLRRARGPRRRALRRALRHGQLAGGQRLRAAGGRRRGDRRRRDLRRQRLGLGRRHRRRTCS